MDRPIIFSGSMVRALLDGRKTQTRRLASSPLAKAQPGDRLWTRETWGYWPVEGQKDWSEGVIYRATDDDWECRMFDWSPSIFMPRRASRLTLIVEAVKVEPLQDISGADAEAEGRPPCPRCGDCGWVNEGPDGGWQCDERGCGDSDTAWYANLWRSLHKPGSPGDWDTNPHVAAITFRVERANIDSLPVTP